MRFKELSGNLQVELQDDGIHYKLLRDYRVLVEVDGKLKLITVPKDFVTDFASSPAWVRSLAPNQGKGISEASVIHDWLYQRPGKLTRKMIDGLFLAIMLEQGTAKWRARLMHAGARAGGWRTWKKYRKAEQL